MLGQAEVTWKIIIVKDDLKEAPIEQLQVILSDSENAIIINHNRTVVSIYDFNTGNPNLIWLNLLTNIFSATKF